VVSVTPRPLYLQGKSVCTVGFMFLHRSGHLVVTDRQTDRQTRACHSHLQVIYWNVSKDKPFSFTLMTLQPLQHRPVHSSWSLQTELQNPADTCTVRSRGVMHSVMPLFLLYFNKEKDSWYNVRVCPWLHKFSFCLV
jgi:hypothetical protein